MVEVIEHYQEFSPPCDAKAVVEDLLSSAPPELLAGLRSVVLTNTKALTGGRKRRHSRSRGGKVQHAGVLGLYHPTWNGEPAWIEVFVDQTLAGRPAWLLHLSLFRAIFLGSVLYHELGHHIHATAKPEHREKEKVADEWQTRLARRHVRSRHPLTAAFLRPVIWALMPWVRWARKRRAG